MLSLNQNSISQANSASQYDAGSALAREAEAVYREGLEKMQPANAGTLNERQQAILTARLDEWKSLVEKAYNDIIAKRAAWMPWTVCGPARYNSRKNSAKADRQQEAAREWNDKMDRFVLNTLSMIRDAIPHEQLIAEYRSGKRREAISGDDPYAAEKLAARIEGLKEYHQRMKDRNAWWRKHGTMKGCPGLDAASAAKMDNDINDPKQLYHVPYAAYELQLNNANIKRLEERLQTIQRQQAAGDAQHVYNGFTVEQSAAEGRINITFDEKPDAPARDVLKSNGFHWSPRAKVWTRQLTDNALRAVRLYVVPGLLALDDYSEAEQEPPQEAAEQPAMSLDEFAEQNA